MKKVKESSDQFFFFLFHYGHAIIAYKKSYTNLTDFGGGFGVSFCFTEKKFTIMNYILTYSIMYNYYFMLCYYNYVIKVKAITKMKYVKEVPSKSQCIIRKLIASLKKIYELMKKTKFFNQN